MKFTKILLTILWGSLILAICGILLSCSRDKTQRDKAIEDDDSKNIPPPIISPPSMKGILKVYLTDAPSNKFQAINVTISRVDIVYISAGETLEKVITINNTTQTFNLLDLRNGVRATLGIIELPKGVVTQIRLIVTEVRAVDKNGIEYEVFVPSGKQTGIKLTGAFVVTPGSTVEVFIDFDGEKSIVYAPGKGYILNPVIKILNELELLTRCTTSVDSIICTVLYFVNKKPEELELSSGRVRLKISSLISIENIKNSLENIGVTLRTDINQDIDGLYLAEYNKNISPLSLLAALNGVEGIEFVAFPVILNDIEAEDILLKEVTFVDTFVTRFKKGIPDNSINELNLENGVEPLFSFPQYPHRGKISVLRKNSVFSNLEALLTANKYSVNELTVYAHPDFRIPVFPLLYIPPIPGPVVNDTYFPYQWNLFNIGQITHPDSPETGTPGADINILPAWRVVNTSNELLATVYNPTIAVIDTGVDFNHIEFSGKIVPGCSVRYSEKTCPDFIGPDRPDLGLTCGCPLTSAPANWHGTAVAGISSARGGNGSGIAGISWNSKIMPIHALNAVEFCIPWLDPGCLQNLCTRLATAFYWAIDPNGDGNTMDGADVINNSWHFDTHQIVCQLLLDAMEDANIVGRGGRGTIIVFAAGNDGNRADPFIDFPQEHLPERLLVVGASDFNDQRLVYSSIGSALDIMAPSGGYNGVESVPPFLWSTILNNQYAYNLPGTSFSAPHVAGSAGILLSLNPLLTGNSEFNTSEPYQIQNLLLNAVDTLPGDPDEIGRGRLNIGRAVDDLFTTDPSSLSYIPFPYSVNMGCSKLLSLPLNLTNTGDGTLLYYVITAFYGYVNGNFVNLNTYPGTTYPGTYFGHSNNYWTYGVIAPGLTQTLTVRIPRPVSIFEKFYNYPLYLWSSHFFTWTYVNGDELQFQWLPGCLLCLLLFGSSAPDICPWCFSCEDPEPISIDCESCFRNAYETGADAGLTPECHTCSEILVKIPPPLSDACSECLEKIKLAGEAALEASECKVCAEEIKNANN